MKPFFRVLVVGSVVLNLLCVGAFFAVIDKRCRLSWLSGKVLDVFRPQMVDKSRGAHPKNKLSVFEQLPVGPEDTVFIGDSLFDLAEWHEYFGDNRYKNRSFGGADTHIVLKRLNQVMTGSPGNIVILLGINNFQKCMPYGQTTREYKEIVAAIAARSPGTQIWLLPVLPVNTPLFEKCVLTSIRCIKIPNRGEIDAFNAFIQDLAEGDPQLHFVDMPALLDPAGELRKEFTYDGLHLNGLGLKEVALNLQKLGFPKGGGAPDTSASEAHKSAHR